MATSRSSVALESPPSTGREESEAVSDTAVVVVTLVACLLAAGVLVSVFLRPRLDPETGAQPARQIDPVLIASALGVVALAVAALLLR